MKAIVELLSNYTTLLCRIFEITPEQIERAKRREPQTFRLEGARGLHC